MENIGDMDFRQIAPRLGGQREAFEELCCQLARRKVPAGATFARLHGAGGDGGVECFADLPDESRVGWQAKYVFEINALLTQATESLITALRIHPTLTQYVICFPFELTGPTGRRGRSGVEKFEAWRQEQVGKTAAQGRTLVIEAWPASELRSLLLDLDVSGGIRTFFFDTTILSPGWFDAHLRAARVTAGPRYTPELNVRTDVGKWLAAFGRTTEWSQKLESHLSEAGKRHKRLREAIDRASGDSMSPKWPDGMFAEATALSEKIRETIDECSILKDCYDEVAYGNSMGLLGSILSDLSSLETKLVADFEARHGPGKADSPGFRQFMAEYQVSFPAANLDTIREVIEAFCNLHNWLGSPEGSLAFSFAVVLSGQWGVGKTHGVCDVSGRRLAQQLLSCVVFGHQFGGEPDPWTRLAESLGLPIILGKDELLDTLNAAAEASGQPLILFMDAINETRPLQYWRNRIGALVEEIKKRPSMRVCFTCRTPYLPHCLPEAHGLPVVEHPGFKGVEHIACTAFFNHYGLKPPVAPILQPELANPLYLRLVCETLNARGLDRIPTGWSSAAQVIAAFLEDREKEFSREKGLSPGACIITTSLRSIARLIAETGQSRLRWSEASRVVRVSCEEASTLHVIEWLVGANLLIEEAPDASSYFPAENMLRLAFERLGDFLIASELASRLREVPIESTFHFGGPLYPWVQDKMAVEENNGVLSALSILIPEQHSGIELSELVTSEEVHHALLKIVVASIPGRDPSSFSSASRDLILEALRDQGLFRIALDSMLSICWRQSAIDATWLHELLSRIPLAQRDAFWCGYLNQSYEQTGPVRRLIDAAFDLPLDALGSDVAERWASTLLWFAAAADRRVKDWATRALIRVVSTHPAVIPGLLARFLCVDDDEVRERVLLASYGALILSRDTNVIERVTADLNAAFRDSSQDFENALIRDHIRCISELSLELNVLPEGCDPQLTMQPIMSEWPLELPSKVQIEAWGELLRFKPNEFFSDFFKYSMGCLRPWEHAFPRKNMGEWILQRVARDFGYEGSGCKRYDGYMLGKHGGGRGKPTWAERIGKKYLWVGMYQLASRLNDHLERKQDEWHPKPLRTPLILLEERKLDPTLPPKAAQKERQGGPWWVAASADLGSTETLSDEEWVNREKDVPSLDILLSVVKRDGQNWRLLVSYPSWGHQKEDANWNDPYRHMWMHIESYLVQKEDFNTAYNCLHKRNFFGRWMPEGASWTCGFAGEYPWATPFHTEPDEWHGLGGIGNDLPVTYQPSSNQVAVEWEYDASILENFHMIVPARAFLSLGDLWWNGQGGYRLVNGRTLFQDPSVMEEGPASLIADAEDLFDRLKKLGLRLVWTLLGEKGVLGGRHDQHTPRRIFSQIARLNEDGSVHLGERVFFDDYDKDTGPISSQRKSKEKHPQVGNLLDDAD